MITDLRLQHFRSYDDESFELASGVNIIVGPNASGKTNLLEAILVICRGSSYRVKDAELIAFGRPWARLDADTPTGRRVVKLLADPASKQFEIDSQQLTRLHQSKTLPVVLFEPNHLLLLGGAPELRRSFMDDLIEQIEPDFSSVRRHYRRVLAQRNALLKKHPKDLAQQLFVWNIRLSELGGRIARDRAALIQRFAKRAPDLYTALSADNKALELSYSSRFPMEGYETSLLHKLESSTEQDVVRGFTAYGPHRDDLGVSIAGHTVVDAASRGETRTIVLALKLLELQIVEESRKMRPILLLDDVFSELDTRRRQALTRFVADYQTFITTTDADVVVHHFTTSHIIPLSLGRD